MKHSSLQCNAQVFLEKQQFRRISISASRINKVPSVYTSIFLVQHVFVTFDLHCKPVSIHSCIHRFEHATLQGSFKY